MQRILRLWTTAGVALAGASLIAVTPVTPPLPDVQHRSVRLSTIEHGDVPFPEVDWNDFVANTTANWNGLMDMFNHTTAIWSLPSAVYKQGLPQVFKDLSTELQALAAYAKAEAAYHAAVAAQHGELVPTGTLPTVPPFPNLYTDPVLNPISALSLLLQHAISKGFAQNAARVGWEGVHQNMLPSINDISTQFSGILTQLKDAFTGGSLSATELSAIQTDFTTIGTDVTNIGNYLSLAPTTILNDYLNGYPVVSSATDPLAGTIPTIGDAYTLNAPFNATDNVKITPEFGLLTNPYAAITTDSSGFGDATSSTFDGTVPLQTGTLASLLQTMQTLSDELLTETSTIAGSGVTAPPATGPLTILGPDSINFNLNLLGIPVLGTVINLINNQIIPFLNSALITTIETTNDAISGVNESIVPFINSTLPTISNYLTDTVNPLINAIDPIIGTINFIFNKNLSSIGPVTINIPSLSSIPLISLSDIPHISPIDTTVSDTFAVPNITEPGVPAYVWDIGQNDMAILSSMAGLAAPVTGTVSSDSMGNFLADNPVMNLGTLFDSLAAHILSDTPLTLTAILPLDWTNLVAEALNALFTA